MASSTTPSESRFERSEFIAAAGALYGTERCATSRGFGRPRPSPVRKARRSGPFLEWAVPDSNARRSGQQAHVHLRACLRVREERGAARAVVRARATDHGHRRVLGHVRGQSLEAQRALRQLGLERAEDRLRPDERAVAAADAGVVAGDLAAEADAVALLALFSLGEEADALLRGRYEVQCGAGGRLRRAAGREYPGGGEGGGSGSDCGAGHAGHSRFLLGLTGGATLRAGRGRIVGLIGDRAPPREWSSVRLQADAKRRLRM